MPLFLFKTRSVLCLSPQSKSPVSSAKIPVQPPPQSSAGEQQQACVHPRRDRQSQRADGTGEQCVYISACELIYITQPGSISFLTLCLLQDVSCNEIQVLPAQVGRLHALRELNIRKNCLHMLPEGQFATNSLEYAFHRLVWQFWQTRHHIIDKNYMCTCFVLCLSPYYCWCSQSAWRTVLCRTVAFLKKLQSQRILSHSCTLMFEGRAEITVIHSWHSLKVDAVHWWHLTTTTNHALCSPLHAGSNASHLTKALYKTPLLSVPAELADLPLIQLDFSCNKITEIPPAYRKLRQLQHIILDNNPMQSPPAQVRQFISKPCLCKWHSGEASMWWQTGSTNRFCGFPACGWLGRLSLPSHSRETWRNCSI